MSMPNCPECNSEYTYNDGHLYICPECAYEWTELSLEEELEKDRIYDAHGTELNDGDDVIVIKDLKVRGASDPIKQGTKATNIKLKPGEDHDIECRADGSGSMELKSEFVKKA